MRVLVVGRTYALEVNRRKWQYLGPDVELAFVTPRRIVHTLKEFVAEPSHEYAHFFVRAVGTNRLSGFWIDPVGFARVIACFEPNLVQIDEEPASPATLEMSLIAKGVGVMTIFFSWENLPLKRNWLASFAYALNLRLADGAIVGSKEAAQILRYSGFSKPITVIPQLGVDPAVFKPQPSKQGIPGLESSTFTIGYVGRITPEKGLWVLMDALLLLRSYSWQLLLVGEGPIRKDWLAEAQKKGIADRVIWVPTVPHQEVARYINAMDVLVLPSLTTPRWKEQFGHVLIEAMACGVPVIGSSSGAIPEVIGDAGLVVPEGIPGALAEAINLLRISEIQRMSLGQRGRARVLELYTNERIGHQTLCFWREVIDARKSFCR